MMSFLVISLGFGFCASRKGGTGGGGWVHPKGTNSMAVSGLIFRSNLVGTGRAISATAGGHFSRDLTRRLLIGGCGQSHVSAKHG